MATVYQALPIVSLPKAKNVVVNHWKLVGSCNGLLCLYENSKTNCRKFCLWNPATREFSEEFGWLPYGNPDLDYFDFMFGYDASTRGYKIVAFRAK
jgi:hypothetical protein